MRPRWSRTDGLALGGLLLLPALWYFTPLFTDACYYLGDLTAQYRPWWSYAHESLREGRVPLWNPWVLGGMPYNVNPENCLFYPLKLPLLFLPFFKAVAVLRVLDAMVAAGGAYLLLRHYGTRPLAGVLGALMFTYGSFMSYEFVHVPYVNTAVWFPWELLFLERLLRRPRVIEALGLAVVTATSFLGGSPGVFLICQITLAFFLAAALLRRGWGRPQRRTVRALALLGLAAVLVVGLTLVLLLPAFEFIRFTPRSGGIRDLSNFTDFALIPEALDALVFPWAHQRYGAPYPPIYPIPFLNVPYLGVGAVLLALLNLRSRRHAHLMPLLLAVGTFSVLMAMGTRTGLFPWLMQKVALFGWFRWPHDYLLMSYLVLWIAAATGFDALWRAPRRLRRFGWVAAAYLAVGLFRVPHWSSIVVLGLVVVGCGLAFALAATTPRPGPRSRGRLALGGLAVVLLAADLFVYGSGLRIYLPRESVELAHCRPAIDRVLADESGARVAFSTPGAGTHFAGKERVFGRHIPLATARPARNVRQTDFDAWLRRVDDPDLRERLWQRRTVFHNLDNSFWDYPVNASMQFGYREISGYDPFAIERVLDLYDTLPFERSWDLLGVRYVVTPNRLRHDGLVELFDGGTLHVYRNPTALPRVFVPASMEDGLGETEVLARLGSSGFDPLRRVLFEEALPPDLRRAAAAGAEDAPAGRATLVEDLPERLSVTAEMKRAGFVVFHDVYHPGWYAYVDGEEAAVYRANHVFRAVPVPPGSHRVELVYRPADFRLGARVSAASWLLVLLSGVWLLRGRAR